MPLLLQLKSKNKPLLECEFAQLVSPDVSGVKSDSELYALVTAHGSAIVHEYNGVGFTLKSEPTMLSPEEFESKWMGD